MRLVRTRSLSAVYTRGGRFFVGTAIATACASGFVARATSAATSRAALAATSRVETCMCARQAYNTLSVYIKLWLGGVRKVRKLLDQEHHSTIEWTREKAIEAYKQFHDTYGIPPGTARMRHQKYGELSEDVYLQATRIASAVAKYAGGGKAVRESLGIERTIARKWTKEKVVAETKTVIDRYGLTPTQLLSDHRAGHIVLPDDVKRQVSQLIDAANRLCGGMAAVVEELGFARPSHYRGRC